MYLNLVPDEPPSIQGLFDNLQHDSSIKRQFVLSLSLIAVHRLVHLLCKPRKRYNVSLMKQISNNSTLLWSSAMDAIDFGVTRYS